MLLTEIDWTKTEDTRKMIGLIFFDLEEEVPCIIAGK